MPAGKFTPQTLADKESPPLDSASEALPSCSARIDFALFAATENIFETVARVQQEADESTQSRSYRAANCNKRAIVGERHAIEKGGEFPLHGTQQVLD